MAHCLQQGAQAHDYSLLLAGDSCSVGTVGSGCTIAAVISSSLPPLEKLPLQKASRHASTIATNETSELIETGEVTRLRATAYRFSERGARVREVGARLCEGAVRASTRVVRLRDTCVRFNRIVVRLREADVRFDEIGGRIRDSGVRVRDTRARFVKHTIILREAILRGCSSFDSCAVRG